LKGARATLLAAAIFLVAALLSTWPQAKHLRDGLTDVWDAKFTGWVMHWDFHQTFRDPFRLFHANIFRPARYALAFSENLYGAAVFGFPLYAAGFSTLAAYNVLFFLGMFLSGMGAWALARWVTGHDGAALLAGLIYAFNPWRLAQIPHIQFQWGAFLPLFLLFLLKYLDSGRRRDAVLFALFFAWNVLCNMHYAVFGGMAALVVLGYEALAGGLRQKKQVLLGSLIALAVACLAVLPFLWPYWRVARLYGSTLRSADEMLFYSGRVLDFLTAGAQNKLYAPLTQKWGKPEGDFFPGLIPVFFAMYALLRLRFPRRERPETPAVSPRKWKAVRVLDLLALLLYLLWLAATLRPGLKLGPLSLADPGRIVVFITAVLLARLTLAFPRESRFRDLSDFLRSLRFGSRAGLFLAIAVLGALIALGGNTPFYRFLFQSSGPVLRGVRVPARGIAVFHVGLGVLAAWGLTLIVARQRSSWKKGAWVAGALLATGVEYRAFPVAVLPVEERAAPVYQWLGTVKPSGAVIEWPFGTDYDVEYEYRSTAHWHPLVNGYSGAAPAHYYELWNLLKERPISDVAFERIREMGGTLVLLHVHAALGGPPIPEYSFAARRWVLEKKLHVIASFPHDNGKDYVFRTASAPSFPTRLSPEQSRLAAEAFHTEVASAAITPAPPFGAIESPRENELVAAGSRGFGWALDDSGIAQVRVASDSLAASLAVLGDAQPRIFEIYPQYPDAGRAGFGFTVPNLPPGPHTLVVTLVAKDGEKTVLHRPIRIR